MAKTDGGKKTTEKKNIIPEGGADLMRAAGQLNAANAAADNNSDNEPPTEENNAGTENSGAENSETKEGTEPGAGAPDSQNNAGGQPEPGELSANNADGMPEEYKIRNGSRVARLLELGLVEGSKGKYILCIPNSTAVVAVVEGEDIETATEEEWNDAIAGINGAIAEFGKGSNDNAGTGLGSGDENEGYPVYPNDNPFKAKETHEAREKRFGVGYVVVTNGRMQGVRSKIAWEKMSGAQPWKQAVQMPPEVVAQYKEKHGNKNK